MRAGRSSNSKAKRPVDTPASTAAKQHDIAIPLYGYKNHAAIDQRHGFIRGWIVTSASAYDGAQLRKIVRKDNTASMIFLLVADCKAPGIIAQAVHEGHNAAVKWAVDPAKLIYRRERAMVS